MIINFSLLIITSVFWSIGFIFVKISERSIPPVTTMFYRSVIAFATLFIICIISNRSLSHAVGKYREFILFSIIGITIPWLGIAYSEKIISSGLVASMLSTIPIFTFIITSLIIKSERFTTYGLAGLLISLSGIILVIGVDRIFSQDSTLIGILIVLCAFLSYAINGILVTRISGDIDAIIIITYTIGFSTIFLTVLSYTIENPFGVTPTTENIPALLALGVISTALMFLGYYILLKRAGALFTSLLGYLAPVSGIIAGIIFLNESIRFSQAAGVVLVLIGVFLVSYPKFRSAEQGE